MCLTRCRILLPLHVQGIESLYLYICKVQNPYTLHLQGVLISFTGFHKMLKPFDRHHPISLICLFQYMDSHAYTEVMVNIQCQGQVPKECIQNEPWNLFQAKCVWSFINFNICIQDLKFIIYTIFHLQECDPPPPADECHQLLPSCSILLQKIQRKLFSQEGEYLLQGGEYCCYCN